MPECSKSHGVVLCWVNEEEADGSPALPFTHPLTSVLCFYDSGGIFHATPVVAIPHSSPSGSSCRQLQSSPWVSPAGISRHASQAGDCVQVAQSLSPGLSALPAPCSSKSLKTSPSLSIPAGLHLEEGLSREAEPVLYQSFFPGCRACPLGEGNFLSPLSSYGVTWRTFLCSLVPELSHQEVL